MIIINIARTTYLECNIGPIKYIQDGLCYVQACVFLLETVEANERALEQKAAT
jgi:hypothetical protein